MFGLRLHANNMLYKEIRTIPVSVFNSAYNKKYFGIVGAKKMVDL